MIFTLSLSQLAKKRRREIRLWFEYIIVLLLQVVVRVCRVYIYIYIYVLNQYLYRLYMKIFLIVKSSLVSRRLK